MQGTLCVEFKTKDGKYPDHYILQSTGAKTFVGDGIQYAGLNTYETESWHDKQSGGGFFYVLRLTAVDEKRAKELETQIRQKADDVMAALWPYDSSGDISAFQRLFVRVLNNTERLYGNDMPPRNVTLRVFWNVDWKKHK